MTVTALGVLLSADGIASRQEVGRDWRTKMTVWANPASELRHHHGTPLPVTVEHDGDQVGQILGVHRAPGSGGIVAWAVAELDGDGADRLLDYPGEIFFSAEVDAAVRPGSATGRDIELLGAALTVAPARLCARPIRLFPGSLRDRRGWRLDGIARTVVEETAGQVERRRRGGPVYVTGWHEPTDADEDAAYYARAAVDYYRANPSQIPRGRIEHGPPGRVLSVR